MTATFTQDELRIIAQCASTALSEGTSAGLARLSEAFGARGAVVVAQAATIADRLTRAEESVEIGNGEIFMRAVD